jgi:prepilin-type processing-associated H-X9-DG protein
MEQKRLFDLWDKNQHFFTAPNTIVSTTQGPFAKPVDYYYCPSDPSTETSQLWMGDNNWRARSNYVVCMARWNSRTTFGLNEFQAHGMFRSHATLAGSSPPQPNPRLLAMRDIEDGSSNTLMMAEILIARSPGANGAPGNTANDGRGDVHNNGNDTCWSFSTHQTPNSTIPDRLQTCGTTASDPRNNLPCVQLGNPNQNAARSRHPGGAQVAMGDGVVKFAGENIDLNLWRKLGTIRENVPAGTF